MCPTAKPNLVRGKEAYVPTALSATAMIISELVITKGMSKIRNPARVVVVQENWCLMNAIWYEPEGGGNNWTQWHTWTASNASEWSGTPREHYNNLHEQGEISSGATAMRSIGRIREPQVWTLAWWMVMGRIPLRTYGVSLSGNYYYDSPRP